MLAQVIAHHLQVVSVSILIRARAMLTQVMPYHSQSECVNFQQSERVDPGLSLDHADPKLLPTVCRVSMLILVQDQVLLTPSHYPPFTEWFMYPSQEPSCKHLIQQHIPEHNQNLLPP